MEISFNIDDIKSNFFLLPFLNREKKNTLTYLSIEWISETVLLFLTCSIAITINPFLVDSSFFQQLTHFIRSWICNTNNPGQVFLHPGYEIRLCFSIWHSNCWHNCFISLGSDCTITVFHCLFLSVCVQIKHFCHLQQTYPIITSEKWQEFLSNWVELYVDCMTNQLYQENMVHSER